MARKYRIYVLVMLLGGMLAAGGFAGGLSLLDLAGRLPPPPLSNRLSLDEKLRYIRENGPLAPTLLAVGSSQTLYHFNGAVLRDLYGPEVHPFIGAANGVGFDKLGHLLDFYLSSFDSVAHVVTITSLPDFTDCSGGDSFFFNHEDAANYAFRGRSAYLTYVEYFDPWGLLHTAFFRQRKRLALTDVDEFGALEKLPESPARLVPYLYKIDDACFANLREVARNLTARGIAFTVVLGPLKPAYIDKFDPEGSFRNRFFDEVEKALVDTGAQLFNANKEMVFRDEEFWDATHLFWDPASRLTYEVALRVGADGRGSGRSVETTADAPIAGQNAWTN